MAAVVIIAIVHVCVERKKYRKKKTIDKLYFYLRRKKSDRVCILYIFIAGKKIKAAVVSGSATCSVCYVGIEYISKFRLFYFFCVYIHNIFTSGRDACAGVVCDDVRTTTNGCR